MNIPNASGSRSKAFDTSWVGYTKVRLPKLLAAVLSRSRALRTENRAVDDDASSGADCRVPWSS